MTLPTNETVIGRNGKVFRTYPFVPWRRLKAAIRWPQGMHVLTVGGTGSGKSTVAGEFLPKRSLVVVCVSKGHDDIFDGPYYRDYEKITKWPPRDSRIKRALLWPPNLKTIPDTDLNKTKVFSHMFNDVLLRRGHWCIDIDETHYMCEMLKLERHVAAMMEQARSHYISMWNNTQRPSSIPLAVYVNSGMFFFFQSQEEYDLRRLGAITNKHTGKDELKFNLEKLDSINTHELVFLDRTGRIPPVRTVVELKRG